MKAIKFIILVSLMTGVLASCSKNFLSYTPKGTISGDQLNTPDNIEKLVIAAYSSLGNDHWTVPFEDMWPYGDVRSDDAYKGGGGLSDVQDYDDYELFKFIQPSLGSGDGMWYRLYVGISRVDDALRRLENVSQAEFPLKMEREAEMHFLRGHYFFQLKILFKHIPFFNENLSDDSIALASNFQYTDQELWSKIADEFRFAVNNLPPVQSDAGRPTQYAAEAYMAKVLLYSAYVQNDQNQVISINKDNLNEVVQLVDSVAPHYSLENDYAKNYLQEFDKANTEVIWAIQRSLNDGTPNGRVNMGDGLNYPMSSQYGCCWFHIPSQDLVDAYKTDNNGLPEFTTYANTDLIDSADFQNNTVDPRLDHTVGIPGHPWKYDPTDIYGLSWARTPQLYGPYSSMKEAQAPGCPCLRKVGPFFASSKNTDILRLDDALLWKAEALIELGRQDEALPIINQIRQRAANSTGLLKDQNGNYVSNYHIGLYIPGVNCVWTQGYARTALHWERRLEFAMESYRFFDLVRWGIAGSDLNDYFTRGEKLHPFLADGNFTVGRDEYLPISQKQIDFRRGALKQNLGW